MWIRIYDGYLARSVMAHKYSFIKKRVSFDTLVLSGGGIKCLATCGALKFLEKCDIPQPTNFYATSSGAVISLFLILGYTTKEMVKMLSYINNNLVYNGKIKKGNFSLGPIVLAKCAYCLYQSNGINNGIGIKKLLEYSLIQKGISAVITFENLYLKYHKNFNVFATSLPKRKIKIFNHIKTPTTLVVDAICASICIPFIFTPVEIGDEQYVDGGMLSNYPMEYALSLKGVHKILGIKFEQEQDDTPEKYHSSEKLGLFDLVSSVIDILFTRGENKVFTGDNIFECAIQIPEMSFLNFDLSQEEQQILIDNGYTSAKKLIMSLLK